MRTKRSIEHARRLAHGTENAEFVAEVLEHMTKAGSFLAGPIVGHLLARLTRLIEWNARITNRLPFVMASSWYFALQHRSQTMGDRR